MKGVGGGQGLREEGEGVNDILEFALQQVIGPPPTHSPPPSLYISLSLSCDVYVFVINPVVPVIMFVPSFLLVGSIAPTFRGSSVASLLTVLLPAFTCPYLLSLCYRAFITIYKLYIHYYCRAGQTQLMLPQSGTVLTFL